jgi:adenine-specific DNA methylase
MEGSMVMKALVLVVPLLAAAPVHALVLCTMPDGKKYAGDFPPAGCEVESEYENAPPRPPTADEVQAAVKSGVEEAIEDAIEESAAERDASFLASATRERRQIERELERIASRIRDLEAEIANVPVVNPARYRDTTVGWQHYREDQQTTSDARTALHRQIGDLRGQASAARYKFDRLTEQVKRANGGRLPPSWRPLE